MHLSAELSCAHVLVGGVEVLIQGLFRIIIAGRGRLELMDPESLILGESKHLRALHLRVDRFDPSQRYVSIMARSRQFLVSFECEVVAIAFGSHRESNGVLI